MRIKRNSRERIVFFSPDESRVKDFRRRFQVGDRIKAKVLYRRGREQAIIQVGSMRLIAYLKAPVKEGSVISLEVKQLYPHIVLRQHIGGKGALNLYI